jgi:hypothetical protein
MSEYTNTKPKTLTTHPSLSLAIYLTLYRLTSYLIHRFPHFLQDFLNLHTILRKHRCFHIQSFNTLCIVIEII